MKKSILLISLMLIFSLSSVFALDCGFQNPTPASTTGTIGNNTILNASYSNAGTTQPLINITFYASSPSTRNSSTSILGNSSNVTAVSGGNMAANSVNITFANAIILEDSNDYTLSCRCGNSTTSVACNSTRTGVTVDRTTPAPPTGITFTNPVLADNTITATINLGLANRCWIRFGGPSVARRAMTLSGSTCTFTASKDNPPNSDYETYLEADDGTNITQSSKQYITIRASQSDGGGILSGATIQLPPSQGGQSLLGGGSSKNPFAPQNKGNNGIIVIAIIVLLLYLRNNKK